MIIQKSSKYQFDKPMIERIKGHTKIELTDVKTKHRKVIESDNTFQTDVLSDKMLGGIFRQGAYDDVIPTGNYTLADIALRQMQNTVGGIMLFDHEITVPSKYMPAGVKMVGNGGYGVTNAANPPELGSYNTTESSIGNNSYQFVYDWNTSQGNGDIASICLTSMRGGLVGMGNPSGTYASSLYNICADQKKVSRVNQEFAIHYGDDLYVFDTTMNTAATSSDPGDKTLTVKKYTLNGIKRASIFDCRYKTLTYTWTETIPHLPKNITIKSVTDGKGKIIIPMPYQYSTWTYLLPPNAVGYYIELDCTTDTFTMKSWTNHTGMYLYWGGGNHFQGCVAYDGDNNYMLLEEHTDYTSSDYEYALVLVNLTDGTIVKTLIDSSQVGEKGGFKFADDLWYFGYAPYGQNRVAYIYDAVNDTSYPTNAAMYSYATDSFITNIVAQSYVDAETGLIFCRNSTNNVCYYNPCFLATINNLDNVVTKNATQTMKVTYTLTEE